MEDIKTAPEPEVTGETTEQVAEPVAQASEPMLLTIAGREFDISTPEGRLQAQTWGDAFSAFTGKQSNEVGELRKFKARMAPTKDETELLGKVSQLRDSGEHRAADELLFGFAKQTTLDAEEKLRRLKENDATWRAYFKSRRELTETFDEDTIRDISEAKLNIYDAEDPFKLLDSYWLPRLPGKQVKATQDKPIATISGSPKSQVRKPVSKEPEYDRKTFDDMLDSRSISVQLGKFKPRS